MATPSVPTSFVRRLAFPRPAPVIKVQHLNHSFGEGENRALILKDNNLEISPGEIVIMTGPSGSGKTTLLTLLGALRTVQEGQVEILGKSLGGLGPRELVAVRRDIGFIFQSHNLFKSLSAMQNVMMALELKSTDRKWMRQRALECLAQVGLADRVDYKPDQLSGGQRQRVAIARALANKPKLILADEPTAALDAEKSREVIELLRELSNQEGSTCVIVTHDNRIIDVADRIINMVDGRIRSNVLAKENIEICEFLMGCDVFSRLTPGNLSKIAEKMVMEDFPPRATIIQQGDVGDRFYLIKEGVVDVTLDQGDGKEIKVASLGKGQFFGEAALLTGARRNASVRAATDVSCYTLEKEDFQSALAASESLRQELQKVIFSRQ